ncbi:type III secretion system protein [Burkholderia sp. Ac-20384]|uniref:type III secretion system protein n=1 Tax=Burkholderia sp. Ac-20384 TaxID=2703902 RepID=UPI00197ECA2A|nr:type III secretion system protein [Burkholderia sp. Ac-20384]MBN3825133.1 type III secretion system protein [Burkholderia sp. Ac-20384]
MKDRKVIAFERVLSRRQQQDRKLNSALTGLVGESTMLADALAVRRDAADLQAAELAGHDGKIDAMLRGVRFRADDLLKLRDFRAHAAERHAALEAQADHAQAALDENAARIVDARAQILRNRARIDIYVIRRDRLVRNLELAIEDAEDDEISEMPRRMRV